jgi:hypothetical protein
MVSVLSVTHTRRKSRKHRRAMHCAKCVSRSSIICILIEGEGGKGGEGRGGEGRGEGGREGREGGRGGERGGEGEGEGGGRGRDHLARRHSAARCSAFVPPGRCVARAGTWPCHLQKPFHTACAPPGSGSARCRSPPSPGSGPWYPHCIACITQIAPKIEYCLGYFYCSNPSCLLLFWGTAKDNRKQWIHLFIQQSIHVQARSVWSEHHLYQCAPMVLSGLY